MRRLNVNPRRPWRVTSALRSGSGLGLWSRRAPALLMLLMAARALGAPKPPVPDLTQGGQPDKTHDWTLGATGARGWIWGWNGHSTDARQVLVTEVAAGSPADGILAKGDVLLGLDGKPFTGDARIALARAITAAETAERTGVLRLIRWRDGRRENVQLKLRVMGSYSDTAPYDCRKSRRIVELGCRAIAARGLERVSIPNALNALALLASGQKEHAGLVAEYAHKVAAHQPGGHVTWGYAYQTTFLAEYALATRDKAVLPGLRRLSLDIALGQSGVGTWGHAFARPDGILNGYGAMNQPGIVLTIAMILSRQAGVSAGALDRGIAKSAGFLRWYVHKGAVPYGDHQPWPWHEDNGKCSSSAVMFDLLGDREATEYFARMGTAAYDERESGHTGNFFNLLWAPPGVSRCGPRAVAAYFKEQSWLYDLARRWDGSFIYQNMPGSTEGNYRGWDSTGAYLLGYLLPLKSLCLTGRQPCCIPGLTPEQTAGVIAAGRDFSYWNINALYDGRDTAALLAGLSSWSPAVRKRSAQSLSRREGDFVPRLRKMLAAPGPDARDGRYGACEALGLLGARADAAGDELRALLADDDPWLASLAADAIAHMGPEVRKAAIPDLLRMAFRKNPADPRDRAQRAAAEALFSPFPGKRGPKSILANSLDGADRKLLYPAVRSVLQNEDGATRGMVRVAYPLLDDRDLAVLLPAVVQAIRQPSPSDEMFADTIRLAGLDLLSRLHIREGMALCVSLMEPDRWGQDGRIPRCAEYLARYGAHAKELLPQLRQVREAVRRRVRRNAESRPLQALDKLLVEIEARPGSPALRTLKDLTTLPTTSGPRGRAAAKTASGT